MNERGMMFSPADEYRLNVISKKCGQRGGKCPCRLTCEALQLARQRVEFLNIKKQDLERMIQEAERTVQRLGTRPAKLKKGWKFREGGTPVMVFDGEIASFGYEDENGEFECCRDWPFSQSYIYHDDCERHGIRVEIA